MEAPPASPRRSLREMLETGEARLDEPSRPGAGESFLRGVTQGTTLGFGDEIAGALGKWILPNNTVRLGKGAQPSEDDTAEVRVLKQALLAQQEATPTNYEMIRSGTRADNAAAREAHPGAMFAGEMLGGLALPGGAALKGATRGAKVLRSSLLGAGLGSAYGLGGSESETVGGMALDTALGGALGGAGGVVAEGVIAPIAEKSGELLKRALGAVRRRADRGVSKAREIALARARQEATEEVESLTGKLGAETQKGSRMTENIRRIPGEAAQATPEGQAALMRDAARIARQHAEDMLNQAKAHGLEDVPDKVGEFLSKGSKLDKAQKGRSQAQRLLDGAKQMEDDAERVLRGELPQEQLTANLERARSIAMESAPFKTLEGTVLSENLRRLPKQVAEIEAARAARDAATRGLEENVAARGEELLSGAAAKQRLKELGLRYALPLAGAAAGETFGDEYGVAGRLGGAALGWKAGGGANAAIGSLAGAGLRPGLQALYRTATQYPAVMNLGWKGAKSLASPRLAELVGHTPALLPPATRSEEAQLTVRALLEALRRPRISRDELPEDDRLAAQ